MYPEERFPLIYSLPTQDQVDQVVLRELAPDVVTDSNECDAGLDRRSGNLFPSDSFRWS